MRFLAGILLVLLALVAPAGAYAADLFFSEYIEGSSNNKALEIYNGTGADVDLGLAGYNLQIYFNGNPLSSLTINLTGTVADGDVADVVGDGVDSGTARFASSICTGGTVGDPVNGWSVGPQR